MLGLVEIVEIDYIHRRAEFQIIIDPKHQGHGYATIASQLAMKYAFSVLNMHKLYLIVDKNNAKAIHIYKKVGFKLEGKLKDEFFVDGEYHDALRMCIFQDEYLGRTSISHQ
jgi:diamine N-acetyltransferase